MKTQIQEGLISAVVGLVLGGIVLLLAAKGWIVLPIRPEKKLLFLLGICLFSFLFQMLISKREPTSPFTKKKSFTMGK